MVLNMTFYLLIELKKTKKLFKKISIVIISLKKNYIIFDCLFFSIKE